MNDKEHFFKCDICGKMIDMRDLGQAMSHGRFDKETGQYNCAPDNIDVPYSTSIRKGDNVQWTKDKKPLNLN